MGLHVYIIMLFLCLLINSDFCLHYHVSQHELAIQYFQLLCGQLHKLHMLKQQNNPTPPHIHLTAPPNPLTGKRNKA